MTIEISSGCFGPTVIINGKSVHVDTQNPEMDREEEFQARVLLIDKLRALIMELDTNDCKEIAEIIVGRGDFDLEHEECDDYCDCCGSSYNYRKYTE